MLFTRILTVFIWLMATSALAATTFVWTQPNKNADGTPLTDLAGNKIYCGMASGVYTIIKDPGTLLAGSGQQATYPIASVLSRESQYYCAVTAYDTAGNESTKSNEISVPFGVAPDAPVGFGVK